MPARGPVGGVIADVMGGIRSGMTYCGAVNLKELQRKAQFMEVSRASVDEGLPMPCCGDQSLRIAAGSVAARTPRRGKKGLLSGEPWAGVDREYAESVVCFEGIAATPSRQDTPANAQVSSC